MANPIVSKIKDAFGIIDDQGDNMAKKPMKKSKHEEPEEEEDAEVEDDESEDEEQEEDEGEEEDAPAPIRPKPMPSKKPQPEEPEEEEDDEDAPQTRLQPQAKPPSPSPDQLRQAQYIDAIRRLGELPAICDFDVVKNPNLPKVKLLVFLNATGDPIGKITLHRSTEARLKSKLGEADQ